MAFIDLQSVAEVLSEVPVVGWFASDIVQVVFMACCAHLGFQSYCVLMRLGGRLAPRRGGKKEVPAVSTHAFSPDVKSIAALTPCQVALEAQDTEVEEGEGSEERKGACADEEVDHEAAGVALEHEVARARTARREGLALLDHYGVFGAQVSWSSSSAVVDEMACGDEADYDEPLGAPPPKLYHAQGSPCDGAFGAQVSWSSSSAVEDEMACGDEAVYDEPLGAPPPKLYDAQGSPCDGAQSELAGMRPPKLVHALLDQYGVFGAAPGTWTAMGC